MLEATSRYEAWGLQVLDLDFAALNQYDISH